MNHLQPVSTQQINRVRWLARIASLGVCAWFTLLLFLVATNEDKPALEAIPALLLVAFTIIACFSAWRWERAGGIVIITGAIAIGVALILPSSLTALGLFMPFVISLYVVPFGAVGALFVSSGWRAGR